MASRIFDLGNRRRCVVSFTPRPLYHRKKSPLYPLIGGWESPRASLEAVDERILCDATLPRRELFDILFLMEWLEISEQIC
jgi:hypothetical protein